MKVNEDYFKDIDIKDDDMSDDGPLLSVSQFSNGKEFLDYCQSHYVNKMEIWFNDKDFEYIKPRSIKKISKILDNLFDLYRIRHSEVFIMETCAGKVPYQLFDYGYKHLSYKDPEQKTSDDYTEDIVCVTVYLDLPVFTRHNVVLFMYRLIKSLFTVYDERNFRIWGLELMRMNGYKIYKECT